MANRASVHRNDLDGGEDRLPFGSDPRSAFRRLRNYVAGRHLGSTRDETLLQETVKLLIAKAELDVSRGLGRQPADAAGIRSAWADARSRLSALYGGDEPLAYEDDTLEELDRLLAGIDVHTAETDV